MKMWYVEVTLANRARVTGVLNGRTERDVRRLVRLTVQGRDALAVSITKLGH